MRIASWNVNSLRVRLEQVLQWLRDSKPDVLAMQETKTKDAEFPVDAFTSAGYRVAYSGQPTYNGVAIVSRVPAKDLVTGIEAFEDAQRRVIAATYGTVRVLNLYVPNGQSIDSDKYQYKLRWLEAMTAQLARETATHEHYVVLDPKEWEGKVLCSEPERDALNNILRLGFCDTFRLFSQPEQSFSWWDYRAAGFRRNRGLRIDLILASKSLCGACTSSTIDVEPRRSERPSDHAPVYAEFEWT
jgi:exodeoxyribonuclease-3